MSLNEIELPGYKLRHELVNSITHGLTALFGVCALILMILKITNVFIPNEIHIGNEDFVYSLVACSIYGASIIVCMSISCIYHALAKNNGKKVLRVLDHDFVFFLVAGTYTPYTLISLRKVPFFGISELSFGWIIFGFVYILIILGIVLNSINMNKYSVLSMVIYLLAGWSIVLSVCDLYEILTLNGLLLLFFGGISFSIGAILYGIGKKKSIWWHSVFHCFVSLGIVLQFLSIYLYVL